MADIIVVEGETRSPIAWQWSKIGEKTGDGRILQSFERFGWCR